MRTTTSVRAGSTSSSSSTVRSGSKSDEVVLLLEPRVLEELRWAHAEAGQALRRDRIGDDDPRRRAVAELVLERRVLVVERRRARDAEPARGDRQLVRAVRERDVEAAALRVAPAARAAATPARRLPDARAAAVRPITVGLDAVPLEQLQRLRVVARRDLDLVAALAQRSRSAAGRRARAPAPSMSIQTFTRRPLRASAPAARPERRSTCRSCQSVNASRPQSWRLRSSRPATWSSSSRVDRPPAGRSPGAGASRPRASRARTARGRRAARPRPGSRSRACAAQELGREQRRGRLAQEALLAQPAHLVPRRRARARSSVTTGSRNGTRASSECAIDARSVFTSRSSTRYVPRSTSWSRASSSAPSVSAKRARRRSTGSKPLLRPVSSARASAEKISFQPWCRSSGGRCAARTNRFAL